MRIFLRHGIWRWLGALGLFPVAVALGRMAAGGALVAVMDHRLAWAVFRMALIGLFVLAWPFMVRRWTKRWRWPPGHVAAVRAARWRYALWLVVIDLAFQWIHG